jgi:hypothetical protein
MLKHSNYDKIKILYELSKTAWFIEKHAKPDAQNSGDLKSYDLFEKCAIDLSKHIDAIYNELYTQK